MKTFFEPAIEIYELKVEDVITTSDFDYGENETDERV